MSDTYLSLVTDFLRETALSGGSAPASVVSATGDQAKAAYWIKQANNQIQREWINWDFLWKTFSGLLNQNSEIVPAASEDIPIVPGSPEQVSVPVINMIERQTLAIIQADSTAHFPKFEDWKGALFSTSYTYEAQAVSDLPAAWSMRPDRVILLSNPIESSGLSVRYDYFRKPKQLLEDADISLIPDDFVRLIVVLAKIMYAEHEDAPEVSAGSHEEYEFLLKEMEAAHLPDQGHNRESSSDADLVVVSE